MKLTKSPTVNIAFSEYLATGQPLFIGRGIFMRYWDLRDHKVIPEHLLLTGYYFNSHGRNWVIVIDEIQEDHHCNMKIYSAPTIQQNREFKNLEMVKFYDDKFSHEFTMSVWGKYYFIKYEENHPAGYQMYHDDEQHNWIYSQADVLNAALKLGIEKGKIRLY
jgi:hypothetical protein